MVFRFAEYWSPFSRVQLSGMNSGARAAAAPRTVERLIVSFQWVTGIPTAIIVAAAA
jgi:hypothetical protein